MTKRKRLKPSYLYAVVGAGFREITFLGNLFWLRRHAVERLKQMQFLEDYKIIKVKIIQAK